jgi:hypothetical protein
MFEGVKRFLDVLKESGTTPGASHILVVGLKEALDGDAYHCQVSEDNRGQPYVEIVEVEGTGFRVRFELDAEAR